MPDSFIIIIAFETVAIFIALILYIIEYRKDKRLHEQKELPLLEELKQKNASVLHDAIAKSQAIISEAQSESLKVVADTNLKSRELEEKLALQLDEFKRTTQQTFSQETQKAIDELTRYLSDLRAQSHEAQTLVENTTKQKVNEFIESFEQNLSDFLVQTQQKSLSAIELELTSARNLIATYKEQQIKIINENILAILERTLSLVLIKKLTLKDHMDEIYDALEKAKVEKFII